ncbi:MAG: kynureninase [Lysobacterales bacterium 69-70]|nr:kynureninase [Xanthomonadaceae bacterium]ODU36222.1 MAG: kynureninase [Xanthomonadaceae bacterium SCN 69-320]ODV17924.1 MAG: kynureninase [Xanthomonadaceae bacterium SCN 69-25]OJY99320.1 MAG: kynureninase [Xanthomonadales bacterium 69-70]
MSVATESATGLDWARAQDRADALAAFRGEFCLPPHGDGEQIYLCGNSLGLMPRATRQALNDELDDWSRLAVEAHFHGRHPWMPYHGFVREHLAELVGAQPGEVVAMNSLSANLHLMMVSFYRPSAQRPAILLEKRAFPSDRYALESQVRFHGYDPDQALIELDGDEANGTISLAAIERALHEHGERIALVLLPGVQYLTGQVFDLAAITRLAHAKGCLVGFDLAHAVGNVPVDLHDSGCDFAVWCHYKYVNSGPGAVAGCFVHERHAHSEQRPRFAGWWGHDQATRFQMGPEFRPTPGADGWQLSNPPILALAPLRVSLDIFHRAGIARLRQKSLALTGYLSDLIEQVVPDVLDVLTPAEPLRRGSQLSLRVKGPRDAGRALFEHLSRQGIVGDWREPDVIRVAPTALYNRYEDAARFVQAVAQWRAERG